MITLPIPLGQARLAGLFYLIFILCGVGSEVALRGPLIDLGSTEATAKAIEADAAAARLPWPGTRAYATIPDTNGGPRYDGNDDGGGVCRVFFTLC